MNSTNSSNQTTSLALDLAWRLWTELGVSGWERWHPSESIDIEPLILHTAWLGQRDRRLWEESVDWCVTNHRMVSANRLRSLANRADPEIATCFAEHSATVRAHAPRANWPGNSQPRNFHPSGKGGRPDLTRPSTLQLRLRALFGVSTRAEVLLALLCDPVHSWSAAELSEATKYAKVNVASVLETLTAGGILQAQLTGNLFRYQLVKSAQLSDFAGPLPGFQPDWAPRLEVITELVRFQELPGMENQVVRDAEAVASLRRMARPLTQLGLDRAIPTPGLAGLADDLSQWGTTLLRYWAPPIGMTISDETVYTVQRTANAWQAFAQQPGSSLRPLRIAPSADSRVPDESTWMPLLAHEMISHAHLEIGERLGPFRYQPATLALAEQCLGTATLNEPIHFSASFLRFWYGERSARWGTPPDQVRIPTMIRSGTVPHIIADRRRLPKTKVSGPRKHRSA